MHALAAQHQVAHVDLRDPGTEPDRDGRSADREPGDRVGEHLGSSGGVERVVHSPAGHLPDHRHHILSRRQSLCHSQPFGECTALRRRLDHQYGFDTGRQRGQHCRQTHCAGAEYGQRAALARAHQVQHRTGTGLESATQRCGQHRIDVGTDDDGVVLGGQRVPGEAGLSEESVPHRPAVDGDPGGPVGASTELVERNGVAAVCRSLRGAGGAAATGPERQHDTVAGLHRTHCRADFFDDSGAFMSEQHRPIGLSRHAIDQIGVADPGRLDPHQDLIRARIVDLHLGDGERVRRRVRQQRGGGLGHGGHGIACLTPVNSKHGPGRRWLAALRSARRATPTSYTVSFQRPRRRHVGAP